ncbi:Disease resistance protein RPV1 [Linum grandiflorum]
MDVAFLSFNVTKSFLISLFAGSYDSAYSLVEDLINKSLLVTVLCDNKREELIVVHDLLKEMAWNIGKAEPFPSRLREPDDICKLFNALEGGKALEMLCLDLSKVEKLCLGAEAFEGMNRLRFLALYNLSVEHKDSKISLLEDRLDSLPNELRWLQWNGFPLESLPEKFLPEKIFVISLRHSQIKWCWKGVQPNFLHLNDLDLSHCLNLRVVPNLSGCKKLQFLRLKGCDILVELRSSVQYLDKLVELDLSNCPNLMRLPATLNSEFLERVDFSNCPKLTLCPEINSSEGVLALLNLEETPLRELPNAVHKVKQGGCLCLCGKHIISFPRISKSLTLFRICHTMITKMDVQDDDDYSSSDLLLPQFDKLELFANSQLVSLSSSIWDMVKHELWVKGSPLIESLPDILSPINDLALVYIENCINMKSFPSGIKHMMLVHTIFLRKTAIKSLPFAIHLLDKLCKLYLVDCESLECIPDNIHELAKLKMLSFVGCIKIQRLRQLLPPKLKYLYLGGCKSLQALPSNIGKLNLSQVDIENCPLLDYKLVDKIAADFYTRAMMCSTDEVNTKVNIYIYIISVEHF